MIQDRVVLLQKRAEILYWYARWYADTGSKDRGSSAASWAVLAAAKQREAASISKHARALAGIEDFERHP